MDIRYLTESYAVSPQISLEDIATLKSEGFTTIIDNRPDTEIPASVHGAAMQAVVETAGMSFVFNPIVSGQISQANVDSQRAALDATLAAGKGLCLLRFREPIFRDVGAGKCRTAKRGQSDRCRSAFRISVGMAAANAGRIDGCWQIMPACPGSPIHRNHVIKADLG